ncbi:hypothetical protein [uncultured Fusobacterium sp.]|uniref:hypothetical protein n=1 Tax=uncultured Fusobacterium sp. TaxID=159267 RepID=UPI0025CD8DFE|nr:hypothetical protein [uncultured Fusobacterium sp.]
MENEKFIIVIYNSTIYYKGEKFNNVLDKKITSSWKKANIIAEKFNKEYLKKFFPERKILIKEKFRDGWQVVLEK